MTKTAESYMMSISEAITQADALKETDSQQAVGLYLEALRYVRDFGRRYPDIAEPLWQKKASFMIFNGMGIAYVRWGKVIDAAEAFADAAAVSPNKEAHAVAVRNLRKYADAYERKTGTKLHVVTDFGVLGE